MNLTKLVNPERHETNFEKHETNFERHESYFERALKKYSLTRKDGKFLWIRKVHKVVNSNYFPQQTNETHKDTNEGSMSYKIDKEGRKQGWRKRNSDYDRITEQGQITNRMRNELQFRKVRERVNFKLFVKAIDRDTHKEVNKSSMGYKSDNEISEARVRKTKFGPQFKLHNKVKCMAQRLLNCNYGR